MTQLTIDLIDSLLKTNEMQAVFIAPYWEVKTVSSASLLLYDTRLNSSVFLLLHTILFALPED